MEDDAPAGVPEWVVTYGDMMSLLLTFFIMLVSLSEVVADQKYRAVMEAIHKRLGYRTGPLAPPGDSYPLNSLIERLKTLGSHTNEDRGRGGVKSKGPPGTDFRVFRRRDGTAINVGGKLAFAPGDAELSPTVREGLREVARVLSGKPNKIEVRGHTSAAPLPPDCPYPDKFLLSYARARNVLDFLEAQGIERNRLRASAAGDSMSLSASGDMQAEDSDCVEIFVLDTFSSDFSGERDVPD